MTTRAEVVAEARRWLGTPYRHQHRAKGHGVDCAGLVIGVARNLGIVDPQFDVNGYARTPDGKSLLEECDRFMTRIPMEQLQPGDVLVFRFTSDPQHLGVVADYPHGGLSVIHAYGTSNGKGEVEERRLDSKTKFMRPVQAYALPGVE